MSKKPNFIDTFKSLPKKHAIDWENDSENSEENSDLLLDVFGVKNHNIFADLDDKTNNDFFQNDEDDKINEELEKENSDFSDDNINNKSDSDPDQGDNEYMKRIKYKGPKTERTKFAYDIKDAQNDEKVYVDLRYNNSKIAIKRNMGYQNDAIDETDPEKYKKNILITQGEFREQLRIKKMGNQMQYKGNIFNEEEEPSELEIDNGEDKGISKWNFEFDIDKSNEESESSETKKENNTNFEIVGGNVVTEQKGKNDENDKGIKPNKLNTKKLPDVTISDQPSMCNYICSDIHRSSKLVLLATTDRRIRIYNVDGNTNPLLQSILLQNILITYAAFTHDGKSIVICGHGLVYFIFDLETGKVQKRSSPTFRKNAHISSLQYARLGPNFSNVPGISHSVVKNTLLIPSHNGYIYIIDLDTNMIVATLQSPFKTETISVYEGLTLNMYDENDNINNNIVEGTGVYMRPPAILATGVNTNGKVAVWVYGKDGSLPKSISPNYIFIDDGSSETTAIATSPHFIACGQVSGYLNIYSTAELIRDDISNTNPIKLTPKYALNNLKAPITTASFNCTGELLYYASDTSDTQGRMIHVLSGSVYQNWPKNQAAINQLKTRFHKDLFIPIDAKFYPDSKKIQICYRGGIISCYELSHYN